jgi:hypothetical protein
MRYISVESFRVHDNDLQIDLIAEDQSRHQLVMSADTANQLLMSLWGIARTLQPPDVPIRNPFLYTVAVCSPISAENQPQGVLIKSAEGFEIPLILNQQGRNALRACIDQLEAGIQRKGPIH